MTFEPTAEQKAIIQAGLETDSSLMIVAYAGCAKTTTIKLLAEALPNQPTLALAFNVKIKKELETSLPSNFSVQTMNGLGHSAFGRAIGKRLNVDTKKLGNLINEVAKDRGMELPEEEWSMVRQMVSSAKHAGLIPEFGLVHPREGLLADTFDNWQMIADSHMGGDLNNDTVSFCQEVLLRSIKQSFAGVIDFDDQIYMSTMFGGQFPRFAVVIADEAQDLSPLNHIQVGKSAAGRLIVVGDPKQAIYAFRGADSDSMGKMKHIGLRPWIELPLSLTFRCPQAVVARQQEHAPGYTAAKSNLPGHIHSWQYDKWSWDAVDQVSPAGSVAILCRNNGPLVDMAFKLIRSGRGVTMMGRDIGKNLVTLLKKICGEDESLEASKCVEQIRFWMEKEVMNARAKGKDDKVAAVTDRAECLFAVVDSGGAENLGQIKKLIIRLFEEEAGRITLATGHKSKGLEWDTVVHLDPWRIPSKYAREAFDCGNPVPLEQDKNLRYVIETRTKDHLILANLDNFSIPE